MFLNLAGKYLELNNSKNAVEILHRAYFLFPNNQDVMHKLATILYSENQKEVCVFLYKELLTLDSKNSTYWTLLGNAYMDLEISNLALISYEKADEITQGKESWIRANIGNLYSNKNLFDKAEIFLKSALTIDEKSDYTHSRLSDVFTSQQDEIKKVNEILATAKAKINSESII